MKIAFSVSVAHAHRYLIPSESLNHRWKMFILMIKLCLEFKMRNASRGTLCIHFDAVLPFISLFDIIFDAGASFGTRKSVCYRCDTHTHRRRRLINMRIFDVRKTGSLRCHSSLGQRRTQMMCIQRYRKRFEWAEGAECISCAKNNNDNHVNAEGIHTHTKLG